MHNHYFVLKRAAAELEHLLTGAVLTECFSQQKNELLLRFTTAGEQEHHVRIFMYPEYQSFYYTNDFAKARGQVFHCFHDAWNKKLISVEAVPFDRCLIFTFENQHSFILKLYGRRSNCILHRPGSANELYHRHFQSDSEVRPETLTGRTLPAEETFDASEPCRNFPVFDKPTEAWIKEQLQSSPTYVSFLMLLQKLEDALIYVQDKPVKLTLLPLPEARSSPSALEALEWFNKACMRVHFFDATKQRLLSEATSKRNKLEKYINTLTSKIKELEEKTPPEQLADILMANLHALSAGLTEATLFNFYSNENITIKLKKELSPQKNAEQLYRKGKNRKKEFEELEAVLNAKKEELAEIQKRVSTLEKIDQWQELKLLDKQHQKQQEAEEILPFRQFFYQGWEIRVGKNAKSNDELTQRYSHKDDLWLHARDVQGSHVLLRYQSGKVFPKNVIEKAAQLAAYYSKRKTDSLCPVIVTPKKYVRKKKGAREGSVIVEREDVVMVVPASFE